MTGPQSRLHQHRVRRTIRVPVLLSIIEPQFVLLYRAEAMVAGGGEIGRFGGDSDLGAVWIVSPVARFRAWELLSIDQEGSRERKL